MNLTRARTKYHNAVLPNQDKDTLIKIIHALRVANNKLKDNIVAMTLELNYFKRGHDKMQAEHASMIKLKDYSRRGRPRMKYTQAIQKVKQCFGDPEAKLILTQQDMMRETGYPQSVISKALSKLEGMGEVMWIYSEGIAQVKFYQLFKFHDSLHHR